MVGQFVTSKAGRDKGEIFVILSESEREVLLCDGKFKTLEHPKKKNRKHVQPISAFVSAQTLQALASGNAKDEMIKREIKIYKASQEKENTL